MTLGIHRLLQPDSVELSDADRRRLVGLQRRVQSLVQPLNFLLLWSKHREHRVQEAVLRAQELLFDIYSFIECFTPEESPTTGHHAGGTRRRCSGALTKSEQLDVFLRELDFTCLALNMALSQEASTRALPSVRPGHDISLLALVRAHRRIKEMQGRSGHLCTLTGSLYKAFVEDHGTSGVQSAGYGGAHAGGNLHGRWSPALSLAAFKVVATLGLERRYHIQIESSLPLSAQGDLPSSPRAPADEEAAMAIGLNSCTRMEFPIGTACHASLLTTGHLRLVVGTSPLGPNDTAVDSLALVWSGGDEFASERPLSGKNDHAHQDRQFAFVFDGRNSGDTSGSVPELALTPLDAVYIARICALDGAVDTHVAMEQHCQKVAI